MTSPSGNQDSPTGALTSLARDLLDGRQDADDVAQDVWLLLGRQSPGRVRSLRSWLSIAIRHVAVRSRQRDRRRAERERIVARPDHAPSVLDQLERKSQQELLTSLVNGLAEPYREVVRLRYLEDREVEEIAADLGRSAATVRSQVKRGLDQLRARMGAERRGRRGLAVLLPWLRRRTRELATAARPAFVLGGATVALLLGVLVVSGGSRREQRIVSAAPARARDWPPDLVPVATAGRSAVAPETASDLGVLLTAGEDASADVQGFVLGPDGKGVAGARILVGDRRGSEASVAARSDAQGHYRIEGVDRQDLIWAEDEERVPSQRHVVGSNPRDGLDLLVGHPSGTLVGRVLWDGRPVPRAEVQLIAAPPRFESTEQGTLALDPPPVRVWTDAGGSFRLGLPLQQNFRLFVQADGHAPLIEFLTRDVEVPVELTLPIPNFLEGRLMRPDGTPAAGARVELVFPPPLPERRTTTDGVGVFRFELLPPGALALRAQEDSAGPSPSCFWEGELAPSDRWLDLTLREEHTLRGRALDGDAPIAGWTVELEELDDMFIRAPRRIETAPDGGFEFPACSLTGRHALRLLEPDDGSGAACAVACEARAGSAPLILRPKEGRLHPGSLALSFEAPALELRPMIVTLHDGSLSKPPWLLANADAGAFSAPRVAAGRHRLRAWIPGIGLLDAGEGRSIPVGTPSTSPAYRRRVRCMCASRLSKTTPGMIGP